MRNFLIATDFSATARHAAEYGYQLAKQLHADILLCNAVSVPSEMPQAGLIIWPMEEGNLLKEESNEQLKQLKAHLQQHDFTEEFRPSITFITESGSFTDVVTTIAGDHPNDFVVMGTSQAEGLSAILLGNHCNEMLNRATGTLLLVPPAATFTTVKKIAFAVELINAESDLEEIYRLIPLAKLINAEILITHIYNEKKPTPEFEKWLEHFLTEVSNKANYSNIYYRIINSDNMEKGLIWLCEHGQVGMLAMHHRQQGFLAALLTRSHTQNVINRIAIPIIVFPGSEQ
jgi:nucleotide-binding universal stress UspA family protein